MNTIYNCHLLSALKIQSATKVLRHLVVKFDFWASWARFPPFSPKQCWSFYFLDCTDHSAYTTLNGGAGGIRELTLDENEMEHMFKYWKASFPKSVSNTFVANCLEAIYANCGVFLYYPSSTKFIFTKATKCVVQSDSWLKKKWEVFFYHRNSDTKTKPGV